MKNFIGRSAETLLDTFVGEPYLRVENQLGTSGGEVFSGCSIGKKFKLVPITRKKLPHWKKRLKGGRARSLSFVRAMKTSFIFTNLMCVVCAVILCGCSKPGPIPDDEARLQGLQPTNFIPEKVVNYFAGMDYVSLPSAQELPDELMDKRTTPREPRPLTDPLPLSAPYDIQKKSNDIVIDDDIARATFGRNTWMLWCGGNEHFWDWLADNSLGFMDLLKVLDSRTREVRWQNSGLVNEPGMRAATRPDRFGLWLDVPEDPELLNYREEVLAEVFDGKKGEVKEYDNIPPWKIYGLSSGIVGLRLFPNPKFDQKARDKWQGRQYYKDRDYFSDPNLIRPFRVGMSCAFCHASAHPLNPPLDPAHPKWENISGSIGSQYLRIRNIFGNLLETNDFVYHLLDSQPPGTIDTSLIASDNINNANTMNAIFGVPQRVLRSFDNPMEELSSESAVLPSLWEDPATAPGIYKKLLPSLPVSNENSRHVPRILIDGSDSIGAWGALARVYLNIGTYSEQWVRLNQPLVGFIPPKANTNSSARNVQLPFTIKDCEEHSVFWQATKLRIGPLRDYFLTITPTMPLIDAKGQENNDKRIDASKLALGRRVFARNCIACHSSIQPESNPTNWVAADQLANYISTYDRLSANRKKSMATWTKKGELWDHDPGQWFSDSAYEQWATNAVENADFWRLNFLSTDYRIPVNYIGTNPGRALGNNATEGHVWEDFSSLSYRFMPSIGKLTYYNPFTETTDEFSPRHAVATNITLTLSNLNGTVTTVVTNVPHDGGGPGFYRPPSLLSIWATAPFLHNNSLGLFNNDPSVNGRLAAFDDAIRKLLWEDKRMENTNYASAEQLKHDHGLIWRTPNETFLVIPGKNVPAFARQIPWPSSLNSFADWLQGLGKWRALPSALLFILGFVTLLAFDNTTLRGRLVRWSGYFSIFFAVVLGLFIYFLGGNLGDLKIGPIPKGTPVDLLANVNPDASVPKLEVALQSAINGLAEIQSHHLEGEAKDAVYRNTIAPALLSVSKCPDFVMDKGHYFPWFRNLSDQEKEALIELLKTF